MGKRSPGANLVAEPTTNTTGRWEDIRVSLGPDAEVTGKLSFATPTRIEGKLKGQIRANDILVIGPQATIEANIEAGQLVVLGEVRGDVRADGRIEICSGGRIVGDIQTRSLVIREGGMFEGASRMGVRPATVVESSVSEDSHP